jgi:hypothetical protein
MAKGTYRLTGGQLEPTQLNLGGVPIRDGEGYGGRPENISETWSQPKNHNSVITEGTVCEVFGNGAYSLTRNEAAKRLELLTGTDRTSCYRALTLNGRLDGICTVTAQC